MKTLLILVFAAIQLNALGQSVQVSGYALTTSVLLENGSTTNDAKTVLLSITDNTGAPVNGINSARFLAYQEGCGANCFLFPMAISKDASGNKLFTALGQGVYRITFYVPLPERTIAALMLRVPNKVIGQELFQ
jgi:hypothetical protein